MRDRLQSDRCSRVLKALADADRLKLVQALQSGPRDVTQLTADLRGKLANISHHLKVLREVELVVGRRNGRHIVYELNPAIFKSDRRGGHLDLNCCRLELDGT
jgi:DNA-binding transcriptional ArsR family regulator